VADMDVTLKKNWKNGFRKW